MRLPGGSGLGTQGGDAGAWEQGKTEERSTVTERGEGLAGVAPVGLRHGGEARKDHRKIPRSRVPLAAPDNDGVDAGDELQRRRRARRNEKLGTLSHQSNPHAAATPFVFNAKPTSFILPNPKSSQSHRSSSLPRSSIWIKRSAEPRAPCAVRLPRRSSSPARRRPRPGNQRCRPRRKLATYPQVRRAIGRFRRRQARISPSLHFSHSPCFFLFSPAAPCGLISCRRQELPAPPWPRLRPERPVPDLHHPDPVTLAAAAAKNLTEERCSALDPLVSAAAAALKLAPAVIASFVENERSLVVAWTTEDPRLGCVSCEVHQPAQLPALRRPACLGLSLYANWAWPMGEAHPSAPVCYPPIGPDHRCGPNHVFSRGTNLAIIPETVALQKNPEISCI
ncbi:uncharacterized protein [Triticum aestivum]|uniref:uncharacterized protein n=1 Tax=Triticum aestivum TaxID=4565 RepID=UPI001D026A48|nr:uncharacterized protein LOC123083832 [Triticum aestivum]